MPATITPAERLRRISEAIPEATELARAVSLSVRAEPELVRALRLVLFPRSGAWTEADLYFSPLVAQRTPDWIVLDPVLARELREGLTANIRAGAGERQTINRLRQAVEQAHAQAPFEIRQEEAVIWFAVERRGGRRRTQAAIESKLRPLLSLLLQSPEQSLAIARWFVSAARRMPVMARETQAFALLAFASSSVLGGRRIDTDLRATLGTFEELSRYLPASVSRMPLWATLTSRGVHLSFSSSPGYRQIDVPRTNPILLEVRGGDTVPTLVHLTPRQALFAPLTPGDVSIRTLSRDLYSLRPLVTKGPAEQGAQDIGLQIIVRSADGDVYRGQVDIECKNQALPSRTVLIRGVDASRPISVTGLARTPQGLYRVTVTPAERFAPVSEFVTIPSSGIATIEFALRAMLEDYAAPGFENDIYLSYAHADSEWVAPFRRALEGELTGASGRRITIFADQSLQSGTDWKVELESKIRKSAAMVAIVTPSYLESSWCVRELEIFETAAREFPEAPTAGSPSRIFAVQPFPLNRTQWSSSLASLARYEFFGPDPGVSAGSAIRQFEPASRDYAKQVTGLARDLQRILGRGGHEAIYVPPASDDLASNSRRLVEELAARGYEPISVEEDLGRARVAVLLVSGFPVRFAPEQITNRPHIQVLVWAAPGLEPDSPNRKLLDEMGRYGNVELLVGTTFEHFMESLFQALRQPARKSEAPIVYLMSSNEDRDAIRPLTQRLGGDLRLRTPRGKPVRDADRSLIYWGRATRTQVEVLLADGVARSQLPIVLLVGPPDTSEKGNYRPAKDIIMLKADPSSESAMKLVLEAILSRPRPTSA